MDKFYKSSFILIISNIITGVLGFTFSILISRELGAEGMGLYGLIMPVYDLFICLICGGMVPAISKVAAVYYSKRDFLNLNRTLDITIFFDLVWGIVVACIVFLNSDFISLYLIKDPRAVGALRILCPAMLCIAVSSILKGYFYGTLNVKIPAFIDIFEKAFRVTAMLLVMNYTATVTLAYLILALGEALSLLFLYTAYKFNKNNKDIFSKKEDKIQLLFDVLKFSFPLCVNGFLSTMFYSISTLVLPRRLMAAGMNYADSLSVIGKFSGMAMSTALFPIIIINALCIVLVPDISENISKKNYFQLENRISKVIRIALVLGMFTSVICFSIPDYLGSLFFNRNDLGEYIKFSGMISPLVFLTATTYAILNGLGRQKIILKNSLFASLVQLVLIYTLSGIPFLNIYGYGVSLIITAIIVIILNICDIKKFCAIRIFF